MVTNFTVPTSFPCMPNAYRSFVFPLPIWKHRIGLFLLISRFQINSIRAGAGACGYSCAGTGACSGAHSSAEQIFPFYFEKS